MAFDAKPNQVRSYHEFMRDFMLKKDDKRIAGVMPKVRNHFTKCPSNLYMSDNMRLNEITKQSCTIYPVFFSNSFNMSF